MTTTDTTSLHDNLLATILSDESYHPSEPRSIEETELPTSLIESSVCKYLLLVGRSSGRGIAEHICLPFGILENLFQSLRARQIIVHSGSAPLNDYYYGLTEQGRERAQVAMEACAYVGPCPVPLKEYVLSAEAQTIRAEAPKREQLAAAFSDISIDENLFDSLGPAINSGAGLFLYGCPGNGKSTLARRITMCFGQQIWVPHAIIEDGQIVKVYDAAFHEVVGREQASIVKSAAYDRRWIKIRRPTVVVGGELTMDSLEIRHDPHSKVGEAPLQLKSNCGCLLIDDFGRQRIEPTELLNRWIIPLENRHDFLTLSTGKKIRVPFEQLIIFSTNLEPRDLVDEAFLRRIPYKIEINNPTKEEFHKLFQLYAGSYSCEYRKDVVDYLIKTHYTPSKRPLRRCHPRDLLSQIRNYCLYNGLPMEMKPEYFDRVVHSYFTVVVNK
jgi:predicted ATPase with chaperone activity